MWLVRVLVTRVVTPSNVWTISAGLVTGNTVSILRERRTVMAGVYRGLEKLSAPFSIAKRGKGTNLGDELATKDGDEAMATVEKAPLDS